MKTFGLLPPIGLFSQAMDELPKAVFKYVGPQRIDILQKLRVRFTQPSCCNDPFEAQYAIGFGAKASLEAHIEKIDRRKHRAYVLHQGLEHKPALSFEEFRSRYLQPYHERGMRELKRNPRVMRERAASQHLTFVARLHRTGPASLRD